MIFVTLLSGAEVSEYMTEVKTCQSQTQRTHPPLSRKWSVLTFKGDFTRLDTDVPYWFLTWKGFIALSVMRLGVVNSIYLALLSVL